MHTYITILFSNKYYCIFDTDAAAIVIKFNQSTYNIYESDWLMQPVLLLCKPLSTDITIQVTSVDVTASGEQS